MVAINLYINLILQYCGFVTVPGRVLISAVGLGSYELILSFTEMYVSVLAKGFASRTVTKGRIVCRFRSTVYLKATIHWSKDFRRIS